MPFARLTTHRDMPSDLAQRLAADMTRLIATDLGKRHDLTSLLIETPGKSLWTLGAVPLADAAHLQVCVTEGTNTPDEKLRFIANAMRLLRDEMPDLPIATYVVIDELRGESWGYDGKTQADRTHASEKKPNNGF